MQNLNGARRFTITTLDKVYNDTRVLLDELVKESPENMIDKMRLLRLKYNNLDLYIKTLKNLDKIQVKGGRSTRKNRRT